MCTYSGERVVNFFLFYYGFCLGCHQLSFSLIAFILLCFNVILLLFFAISEVTFNSLSDKYGIDHALMYGQDMLASKVCYDRSGSRGSGYCKAQIHAGSCLLPALFDLLRCLDSYVEPLPTDWSVRSPDRASRQHRSKLLVTNEHYHTCNASLFTGSGRKRKLWHARVWNSSNTDFYFRTVVLPKQSLYSLKLLLVKTSIAPRYILTILRTCTSLQQELHILYS